jgi:inosine-uridine nucleoside N-ribohydrolase
MTVRPIVMDVDTGVDDALAILLAVRSPEVELHGVSTVGGNVHVSRATANTLVVLDVLGAPSVPVAMGAAAPLARPGLTAAEVHGVDGLGGVAERFPMSPRSVGNDAVAFILETIRRFPDDLTLVATGPLTNVALAIEKDVRAMRRLRALVVMGGAVRVPGNAGPVSEFNFAADPEAAAIVLGAGLPVTLVPLDVTERVVFTRRHLDDASPAGNLCDFVGQITASTMAYHRARGEGEGMFLHDPLAVGVALDASLVGQEPLAIAVETRGAITAGMAVADLRRGVSAPPTASVCVDVEAERFLRLFADRVLR